MAQGLIMVLLWWVLVTLIGWIALPLTRRFFRTFPDRGYILSKTLGLCLACYINWLLCSLRISRFNIWSVLLSIFIVASLSVWLKRESWRDILEDLKRQKRLVLLTETVFIGCLVFFGIIRMCNPDIASTEKMPDFAFLTGILHSGYFPPKDPWYLGESINYFYYGHYQIAFLTQLSGIDPSYAFNLGIVFLFAITFLNAMGVSYGLIKKPGYAVMGGSFVALIGNLDGIIQFFNQLAKITVASAKLYPFDWFNWWMSSRVIVREGVDITINEFPFWSYILGDLHAHVNVVPFSLLVLGIILELFRSSGDGFKLLGDWKESVFRIAVIAVALGAIPVSNTWDTPTYFSLMVLSFIFARQMNLGMNATSFLGFLVLPVKEIYQRIISKTEVTDEFKKSSLKQMFFSWTVVAAVVISAIVFYMPFYRHFKKTGTQGVKLVDPIQRTLADDFITIYGFFFFCMISFTVILYIKRLMSTSDRLRPLMAASILMVFIASFAIFGTFMISVCLTLLAMLLSIPFDRIKEEKQEIFFALSMVFVVIIILLGCEFFYIKDAYGKTLERQNTIFKFYYQAWIFCGISSAYGVYYIRERVREKWVRGWEPVFRLLFLFTFAFPVLGTTVKCAHFEAFKGNSPYAKATMEGIWYMSWRYKGDYQAIQYLKKNALPAENILEATGPAFSHYGRISAATGMSTILGWGNHENIWRDGSWQKVGERTNEIKDIYNSTDVQRTIELLRKYQIKYVYIGSLEREQYPDGKFDKFSSFMDKVMEVTDSDGQLTYLYRMK